MINIKISPINTKIGRVESRNSKNLLVRFYLDGSIVGSKFKIYIVSMSMAVHFIKISYMEVSNIKNTV